MRRKIAAIVAADVAGYSRLVAEDEEETVTRLGAYREVYDDFIRQYGGRIFNTAGDAVLSEFESAVQAVRAAIDIQDALRTRDLTYPTHRKLQFRIGISIGDVIERNGDLLGDGVNIAARLEGLAEAGGICVSRSVHEAVANKISVPFRYLGERQVKNIPHPVAAFAVAFSGDGSEAETARSATARSGPQPARLWLMGGVGLAILAIAGGSWFAFAPSNHDRNAAARSTASTSQNLPPTVRDLYRQAQTFEAQGKAAEARQTYDTIERRGLDLIDPALRYAALLRVQEGRAAAREIFATLDRDKPTLTTALVHALQFDGVEQESRVAALAAQHPDFAPAQYWLGEQYSDDRLGRTATIAERAIARAAYERFLSADAEGKLTPFFVDLSVLADWVDRARAQQRKRSVSPSTGSDKPTAQFTRSNDGWTAIIVLPEPALNLSYRIGDTGTFHQTGSAAMTDPSTAKPFLNLSIPLPREQAPTTIEVRYTDISGHLTDPVAIEFDPDMALFASERQALDLTSNGWLAFRADMPDLLYFTQIVVFRCAIKQAAFGLDEAPADRVLALPPCDGRDPYSVPQNFTPYLKIPAATRSASIRLTYVDGSQSELKTIKR